MKTSLVRIGNSRGVRIPKAVIEQCGLDGEIEMSVQDGKLVIAPSADPRAGWEQAFRRAGPSDDDELLLPDVGMTTWEDEEWEWEW